MMKKTLLAAVVTAATALTLSAGAQAAVLTNAPANAQDFSAAGLAAFNLDVNGAAPAMLTFRIEAGDLTGPLAFNALVNNLTGVPFEAYSFTLQGITFAATGSVTPSFGTLGTVGYAPARVQIGFAGFEPAGFEFGNPFAGAGKTDWLLNTAGLQAGDTFTVTAASAVTAVPEPSSLAMLVPGLFLVGMMGRAARRKRG